MRVRTLTRLATVLGACAALSGALVACGGSGGSSSSASSGASASSGDSGGVPLNAGPPGSGQALFAHNCSQCHSISGHNKPSQQGGDLLHFHASRVEMVQLTREMPVIHHRLSGAEVTAVVDYLIRLERGR